jgi:hypothetical protein
LNLRACFVIRHSSFVIAFAAILWAKAEPAPSAKEILDSVRLRQTNQRIDLRGQLRQGATVVPFQLIQDGGVVRYVFTDSNESLQLNLGELSSELDELSDAGVKEVSEFDRKVRGTDVTYEDIALKFLYWPKAEVVGQEKVRTRDCWKLQLRPPGRRSQYSSVYLWIDKNGDALMRLEGFNWDGKLVKRFEVVSGQKIDNRWFLKQMRIEAIEPGTNHATSRTYLEILKE